MGRSFSDNNMRLTLAFLILFTWAPLEARLPVEFSKLTWYAKPGFVAGDELGFDSGPTTRPAGKFPIALFTLFPTPTTGKTQHYALSAIFELSPADLMNPEPAGIFIRGIGDNWQLYLNGQLARDEMHLDANGAISIRKTSMGTTVPIARDLLRPGKNTIVLHLAGTANAGSQANPAVPGLFFSEDYTMDSLSSLSRRYSEQLDLCLHSVYLFFGLYHLLIFFRRRSEVHNAYFALFAIALALYGFSRSYAIYNYILDSSWVTRIENVSVSLLIPLFLLFMHSYFFKQEKRETALVVIAGFNFLCASIFLFLPFELIAFVAVAWKYAALPAILVYGPYLIYRAIMKNARDARILAVGLILFILTAVFDLVRDTLKLFAMEPLFHYAFFAFVLSIAGILANRFMMVYNETDRLNAQLALKNESLRELDRVKDEFIGTISHEIRTPLNGIVGLAEALAADPTRNTDPDSRRALNLISDGGRRLSRLVGDLIEFVQLRNHELKIRPIPVNLAECVDIVTSLTSPLIGQKPIKINNHIPADLSAVMADPDRLQQILFNLIWNAIKFTEAGEVTIRATQRGRGAGDPVEVEIEDTGIGVPLEKQDLIFESFRQADSSVSRPYGGAGLGLSITRYLVELHGGKIHLKSNPGTGSLFSFTLPVAIDTATAPVERRHATESYNLHLTPIPGRREIHPRTPSRVLAVDDEPTNLEVLQNQLSLDGYEVIIAHNGEEALAIVKSNPPDLVILDVMMPRMSGYQVCEEIRKSFSIQEMPILLITARNQITDLLRGFDAGANDYLTKPFEFRELSARARNLLLVKHASREKENLTALEKELSIARDLQHAVLPRQAPKLDGLKIAARYRPRESVGGDFYDFSVSDRSLSLIMADVSGHGVPAALIAAMIKIAFAQQKNVEDPSLVLEGLNRALWGNLDRHFVTAVMLQVNLDTMQLEFACAGHPPLLHSSLKSAPQFHSARGRIIGLFPDTGYSPVSLKLHSGDRVVVYTDGLTEARNQQGALYGEERLAAFLEHSNTETAHDISDALESEILTWSGGLLDDDMAFVVLQVD
ncbi:MAG: SpoIIE family protein phosphatase [Spirochaetia bacterium]|nr:SpoIIE family protein phosphatase [Spirochaetia bacterium]